MSELIATKTDKEWGYDITLNGVTIPFIFDAEVIKEEGMMDTLIIKIIVGETADHKVIIIE